MAVLSIYWGALFRTEKNVPSLGIFVVDFDSQVAPYTATTPIVGPFIVSAVDEIMKRKSPHPGFAIRHPSEFDNDPMKVRKAVYDMHTWAAVIISANATTLLQEAVRSKYLSYDPYGAAQIVILTARDSTTVNGYITPALIALDKHVSATFSRTWTASVLQSTSISRTALQAVPQALSPAIGFTFIDIRPYGPAVVTPAVSVGLIYLIIIAFFSFSFFLPIHMKYLSPVGHPPLHFKQLILWRWVATVSAYFVLSLCYSLVSLAFQIPFSRREGSHTEPVINPSEFHRATFVVYWMLNFVGMNALGLACENVAMVAGNPYTALWLIFWVITNVATAFYALELAPGFYRWGLAWPLHQSTFSISPLHYYSHPRTQKLTYHHSVVEGTRCLIFDLHSRLGLNFGILITWWIINTAVFPFACYFMRWKGMKDAKTAAARKAQWIEKMEVSNIKAFPLSLNTLRHVLSTSQNLSTWQLLISPCPADA